MTTALDPPDTLRIVTTPESVAAMLAPIRQRILAELHEPDSATGLGRRLGVPRQQLNYHLHQLEAEGLIETVGERQRRGCTERLVRAVATSYVISPDALGRVATSATAIRDHASSAYLVAVAAETIRDLSVLEISARRDRKRLPTLTVQSEVRFGSPRAQHEFAEELAGEVARLIRKYHDDSTPDGRTFRVLAAAYPTPPEPRPTEEPS